MKHCDIIKACDTIVQSLHCEFIWYGSISYNKLLFIVGRDFSHDETLDVPTQVELLIKQATSHENLCQCYIGWYVCVCPLSSIQATGIFQQMNTELFLHVYELSKRYHLASCTGYE